MRASPQSMGTVIWENYGEIILYVSFVVEMTKKSKND